jgi:branched-chain amino acid transport system permease protein
VLLGGLQTLAGPIVGAAVFTWLQDTVARQTDYWQALLGFAILLLVIAFPQGIVGFVRERFGDDDTGTKNGHAGGSAEAERTAGPASSPPSQATAMKEGL